MAAKKKGFQRKKVEALTLGERLYLLRKERHVSMAEFAKQTKIQIKYLRALEAGLYDDLPSPVYIKGFLRSYEHFFNLPEASLCSIFDYEYTIYTNIHNKDNDDKEQSISRVGKVPQFIITPRVLIGIVVTLIFLGIGGYLYYGVNQFVSAPWIDITEPENATVTDAQTILVQGLTHPDAQLTIGGKDIFVDQEGLFKEEVHLIPGENSILLRSTNIADKSTERTLLVTSTFEPVSPTVPDDTQEAVEGVHMIITTGDEDTWIAITADDVDVFSTTVPAGSTHTFQAEKSILITAGKGNQVSVNVNGEDKGLLSEEALIVEDVLFEGRITGDDEGVAEDIVIEEGITEENPQE